MGFSQYGLSAQKEKSLFDKMENLGIKEADIIERFIRSSGAGGQKVNKTSACVYLKHLPTGIEVKCQKERSQILNRFFARRILTNKIENMLIGKKSEEQQRLAKIRRQKRKRSKRAKEKILQIKKLHAQKKAARRYKPNFAEY
ncbi:MAG: peptide chain release factor-like protein [Candidatus Omnitrophota bacterium]